MEPELVSLAASTAFNNASSISMNNPDSQQIPPRGSSDRDSRSSEKDSSAIALLATTPPCTASTPSTTVLDSTAVPVHDLPIESETKSDSIVLETSPSSLPSVLRQLLDYSDINTSLDSESEMKATAPSFSLSSVWLPSTPIRSNQHSQLHTPPLSPALDFTSNVRSTIYSRPIISRPSASHEPSTRLRPAPLSRSPEIDHAALTFQPQPITASTSLAASTTPPQSTEQFFAPHSSSRFPAESLPEKSTKGDGGVAIDHRVQLDEQRMKRIQAMEDEEHAAKKIKLDKKKDKKKQQKENKRSKQTERVASSWSRGLPQAATDLSFDEIKAEEGLARFGQGVIEELEEGEIIEEISAIASIAAQHATYDVPPHILLSADQLKRAENSTSAPSKKKTKKKKKIGGQGRQNDGFDRVPDNGYSGRVQLDSKRIQSEEVASDIGSTSNTATPLFEISQLPASRLVDYLRDLDSSLEPLAPLLQASGVASVESFVEMASLDPSLRKTIYQGIIARGEGIDPNLFALLEAKLIEAIQAGRKE